MINNIDRIFSFLSEKVSFKGMQVSGLYVHCDLNNMVMCVDDSLIELAYKELLISSIGNYFLSLLHYSSSHYIIFILTLW